MERDSQDSSALTLLTPLAPGEVTTNHATAAVSAITTRTIGLDVVANSVTVGEHVNNVKPEPTGGSEQKPSLLGINIYQFPIVLPLGLEAVSGALVNAISSADQVQMSSSVVGVPIQRHTFMPAVGSDVVSCSDTIVDHRVVSQLSPNQNHLPQSQLQGVNSANYEATGTEGNLSPPCYPGSSTYATLTPFQPLPPISTVSDKFSSGGGNGMGFVFMQHQNTAADIGPYADGTDVYSAYKYEKDVTSGEISSGDHAVNCNGFEPAQNGIAMMMNGAGYLIPQQQVDGRSFLTPYSVYGNTAPPQQDDRPTPVKTELNAAATMATVDSLSSYDNMATVYSSNLMSSSSIQSKGITTSALPVNIGVMQASANSSMAVAVANVPQRSSADTSLHCQMRVGSPDQPSSSTDMHSCDDGSSSASLDGVNMDEISTREVAVRVSNELKKYSIPQAVFAQRVLGRSQGTLSDLLRNPKPWSKLKSGRETFRRMWKWLQEPEYQRMASLRIPCPGSYNGPDSANVPVAAAAAVVKQPVMAAAAATVAACKRNRDGTPVSSTQPTPQHRLPPDNQSVMVTSSATPAGPASSGTSCPPPKKPRMVFTEIQRRTLVAIFKEIKRPSKEIQATIAEQLGLKVSTVVNFFMNARRRSVDKYLDETPATAASSSGSDAINSAAVSSTAGPSDDTLRQ